MINTIKEMFLIEDKKVINKINIYFIISILAIIFITLYGELYFKSYLFNMDVLFDTEHYLNIAKNGYTNMKEYAFFPLVPLIMRLFNVIHIPIIGMVLFNNLITLLSAYLLYNISFNIYKKSRRNSLLITLLWLFSPIRVFTFVPYTEALFVFLSLITFYLYKNRLNPLILGIFIGLTVCTRSNGSVLFFIIFIYLMIDMIKHNEKLYKFRYIVTAYIPATIISCLYPIYLQLKLGNWRYFIDVQYQYWNRVKSNIIITLINDFNKLIKIPNVDVKVSIILTFLSIIIALILIISNIYHYKFKNSDLILMLILNIFIIFTTSKGAEIPAGSSSFFRYIYASIPMYLLIDDKSNNYLIGIIAIVQSITFLLVSILFLGHIFVA